MKTSNKIVLVLFFSMFLASIIGIIYVKNVLLSDLHIGDANLKEYSASLEAYSKLKINKNVRVSFEQSEQYGFTLVADSNVIEQVLIVSENNVVSINVEGVFVSSKPIEIHLQGKNLESIILDNGAQLNIDNQIQVSNLDVVVNEGAYLFMNGIFDSLSVNSNTGCNTDLMGSCKNLYIHSSAGSRLNADSLKVNNCKISTSTGAVSNLHVLETFDVNASSGAIINYSGTPKIINNEISMGAKLVSK
ncbi:MAG: DUF2807 domain-containing protein [Bacteroidales bacterium]|nr:DUF2807 domain-containing protein [Bacteroidales bacterium]